ncbi:type II toxin-antitoxin system Phd/YefM family antitoxin [Jannaschia donghaensis]|uniref:Antitoxin n=1 Tax=Jannaschia donghaensis TaxID=420998 RepID=A0A0M6YCF0_9RHOB|nr:type II toxin-antitoxin system Phd/YefM family antitoxin [Jannaschia donghaensis]CTQ48032.1 prevent-host-death family protein [Jannaschia donghaensis]
MWSVQDAKAKFSAVVDAAMAGEPQHVTKRGAPAVVVVSQADWDALRLLRKPVLFGELLKDMPQARDDEPDFEWDRLANTRPRDVEF